MTHYPRDMVGYGATPPKANWPKGAAVAVQFVVNYEEGGENNILHGDKASEAFLSEITGASAWPGQRHWNMESIYEYGARAGFWRLHQMFTTAKIPVTVYGVATALKRSPEQVKAMQDAGWEIASHGLKWVDYKDATKQAEKQDMLAAIAMHEAVTGERPKGWYTGRCSINTVDLICEEGGFDYVSDSYADDLPYWHNHKGKNQLVIPYTLDANDMRFAIQAGYDHGEPFFQYLKDCFDVLYQEGKAGSPKMMSVGLHCRLVGRPGRAAALQKFIDYVKSHKNVWIARRIDIAEHWHKNHRPVKLQLQPSTMNRTDFVAHFGSIFEHSPWIAERAFDDEISFANDSATGLHAALAYQFRRASQRERLKVLKAHPDLAGKLAIAKKLTAESTHEQAGAGLDALTDAEKATFTELNQAYVKRFGFPFIIAVKGLKKKEILEKFRKRINHDKSAEFITACKQVERIAMLRLGALLP